MATYYINEDGIILDDTGTIVDPATINLSSAALIGDFVHETYFTGDEAPHRDMLLSLFPRGPAWNREKNSNLWKLARAFAEELSRIYERARQLLAEGHVRRCGELVLEHEQDYGIPDDCVDRETYLSERRNQLYARMTAVGQLSKYYFRKIATDAGKKATIIEFKPFFCGIGGAGSPCGNLENLFWWCYCIYFHPSDVQYITDEEGNAVWTIPQVDNLVCMIRTYKPANTKSLFAFYGPEFDCAFSFAFNAMPSLQYLPGAFDESFSTAFDIKKLYAPSVNFKGDFNTAFGNGFFPGWKYRAQGMNLNSYFKQPFGLAFSEDFASLHVPGVPTP